MHAGDFENDPYISLIRVGVALTDLNTNDWFKHKKLKNPKNKNSFIDVPWGSSQMIKVVLVMLISGILLSEKHPTRYQLGLW